jgi:predicted permease
MSQFLTEGLVLAVLSAAASVLLATWGGSLLRALLLPDVAWAGSYVDVRTVLFAVGSAIVVGLVAALAPLPAARRVDVTDGLKAGGTGGGPPRSAARSGLLVGQVALSIVLLVGAVLFVRSLQNVSALHLGFDVEPLAWVDPGPPSESEEPDLRSELAAGLAGLPGVLGTALASYAPMRGLSRTRVFLAGRDSLPSETAFPAYNTVSADFFAVTGMRVLEGRTFEDGETGVVVVSEATSRSLWPTGGPLGQCLIVDGRDGPCLEVIGVVEDSRGGDIIEEETERWYFLPRQRDATGGRVLLRVDPRGWEAVAAAARREAHRGFDAQSVRVERMTDALEPQLRPWRLGAQLFTAFGVLALLVTTVGVYAALAYAVSQRTHEMGVRVALGAKLHDILRLVVGEGLRVVALGVVLGALAAVAAGRLVESLLFGVTPRDPVAMAAAAVLLLATGAAASVVPAWRAGQVDPSQTLRQE